MNRLAVEFIDQGLHRALFDAMPLPVFIVDRDVHILECNAAGARLMADGKSNRKHHSAGDVLDCLHAAEAKGGCGHSASCGDCGLRGAVRAAFSGEKIQRRLAHMELVREGKPTRVDLCVSCEPFNYGKSAFVILVLEGLNN